MFWASQIIITTDWLQTREISAHPEKWHELNPIFGRNPSIGKVNGIFLTQLIANYYLTDYLGQYRMIYLKGTIIIRGAIVARNAYLGIDLHF
jgi:hypothetical protein